MRTLLLVCEVKVIWFWHSLHLAPCHPLRITLERSLRKDGLTIDYEIVKTNVVALSCATNWLVLHSIEGTVLDMYIVDIAFLIQSVEQNAVLRLLTGDILHVDIAHCRYETTLCLLFWLVNEVDTKNSFTTLTYGNIAHIDAISHSTTTGVGLDTKHTIEIWRVHLAVFCKYILHTCTDFRTDYHTSVTVSHSTSTHNDIARRSWSAATICISA